MCNASTVPLYTAELFGALVESAFYGMMIPMVIRTLRKLERQREDGRRKNTRVFQAITCLMVAFATWHFAVECYRITYASLHFETSAEKTAWLGDGRSLTQNLKDFAYVLQTLTGDGILLYRCYIMWPNDKWVTALPTLTYLASWGLGFAGLAREIQKIDPSVYVGELGRTILVFFICSTFTVLASTSIILFKIWQTRGRLHSILFAPSLAIFLESGLIYCSLVVVLAALFFSQCAPQIVFIDLLNPIMPTLFCAVILTLSEAKDGINMSGFIQSKHHPSSRTGLQSINHLFSRGHAQFKPAYPNPVHIGVHIQQDVELSSIDQDYIQVGDNGKTPEGKRTSQFDHDPSRESGSAV